MAEEFANHIEAATRAIARDLIKVLHDNLPAYMPDGGVAGFYDFSRCPSRPTRLQSPALNVISKAQGDGHFRPDNVM